MAGSPPPPPSPPPSIDPRSGFCQKTKIFHSLRPAVTLPPVTVPLSVTSYAFSLLPSPLPSHPALVDAATGSAVSFPDLLSQSLSLAASLRTHLGLSPSHVALILSPARLEIPVLYFALLSLGIAVSPANPASTPAEIARLCRLSNPSVAFAVSAAAAVLPRNLPTLLLDSPEFQSLLTAVPSAAAPAEVRQSDTAAILYSSGTTGRVKGVELTHRNVIAELASLFTAQGRRLSPVVQMVTVPLFHVFGFMFCLKAVAVGETAVIQTARFDVKKTLRAVDRFGVTNLTMAPPALLAMVRVCEDGGPFDLSSLEAISCGGAPVRMELIKRFVQRFPNVRLSQGYGLTESSSGLFRSVNVEESRHLGSVGRLISGCEAKIVDPVTGKALHPGMQGELWVRGPTIMKGYIGDQEAASEILNSEGWLKTGDLCYIDDDGFLFVVDRLKELIKYKGYQVPPAELEDLLQTHPNIIEAAVVPYPNEEAGQVPMAFVVRQLNSTVSESQLMEFVAQQVAPYKRIHHVLFVNSIPKNAAGKILRKDLVRLATSKINSKL
uniref:4-coumarate--CoA ligase n=1 Tax=Elaeis guineensis var. tenera TaxID=51953 RepID=A0A6I9QPR1_ELAGV|nr:4-coumarate--CoA ligase-like 5 isoform X1 [Elaeis guineensis]